MSENRESRTDLLSGLLHEVDQLVPGAIEDAEHLRRRILMVLRNLYRGVGKPYEANVINVRFDSPKIHSELARGVHHTYVRNKARLESILRTALEEERLFAAERQDQTEVVVGNEEERGHKGRSESKTPLAFLLMPFERELDWLHDEIRAAGTNAGIEVKRADDIFSAGIVIDQIRARIEEADVIIAVCTGRNPNVFYELGIAEATHRPILIGESASDLPFDVQHFRAQFYGMNPDTFRGRVERAISATLAERSERPFRR